jgi:gliding motility-associated-like protein
MSTNKNKLSSEEQALRDKLNEADFHFQEADWKAIEGEVSAGKWAKYKTLLKTAATFVALSGAVYFLNQEMQPQSEKAPIQEAQKAEKQLSNESPQVQKSTNFPSEEPKAEKAEPVLSDNQRAKLTEEKSKTTPGEVTKNEEQLKTETVEPKEIAVEEEKQQSPRSNDDVFNLTIDGKYCLGEEVNLLLKKNGKAIDESKFTLRWFINNKRLIQQEAELKYSLDEAGEYKVGLKIKDENGHLVSTLEERIHVEALPEVNFTYEDGSAIFNDFTAEFKPTPKNLNYRWFVDDKEISLNENNIHDFQDKGVYFMRMTYTNEANCIVEIEKPVAILEDFGPFANAFSPNGDGKNEEFMPHGFEDHSDYFHFTVANLSGKVVFESKSPQHKWNGKFNNSGEALPQGQYIWKIVVADKKGNKRSFSDQVKLLYLK